MSTPYDTALKLQGRLVETLRRELADATGHDTVLAQQIATLDKGLREEIGLAADDHLLAINGFAAAQIARRREMSGQQRDAAERVRVLQVRTRDALAFKVALEELATAARREQQQKAEAAEQQLMDDQTQRRRRR